MNHGGMLHCAGSAQYWGGDCSHSKVRLSLGPVAVTLEPEISNFPKVGWIHAPAQLNHTKDSIRVSALH